MPEIAEVETVRNTLKNRILGKEIKKVSIYYPPIIQSDIEEFKNLIPGLTIKDIKPSKNGRKIFFKK